MLQKKKKAARKDGLFYSYIPVKNYRITVTSPLMMKAGPKVVRL